MSYSTINDLDTYNDILEKEDAVLVYFSHEQCNVCKVLKPKVAELLENNFPKMKMYYADTVLNPEISGQNKIFSVPTVLAFFGGRETFRKSRNIGINELAEQIERPYGMIFEN
ncbi:MAG: thioredoxin family protein [Bacteroidales bacterium]|nr:thioredoxin family protein [Bacteroidales bacterium]